MLSTRKLNVISERKGFEISSVAMHKRTRTSRTRILIIGLPGALPLHTHTRTHRQVYWRFGWWCHTHTHTHTHAHARLLAQTHISPSRLQECFPFTHLYPFTKKRKHSRLQECFPCTTVSTKSLLGRNGRIADCTVRHPGVERPFYRC